MCQETCTPDAQYPRIRAQKPLESYMAEDHQGFVGLVDRHQIEGENMTRCGIELENLGGVIRCALRMHDLKVHTKPTPLCLLERDAHIELYQQVLS